MSSRPLLVGLAIIAYGLALAWLAAVADPRCKRAMPSDAPPLEIERRFPKDCRGR